MQKKIRKIDSRNNLETFIFVFLVSFLRLLHEFYVPVNRSIPLYCDS